MRLSAVADDVILAWGWRRRSIALAAGAAGALALPPLDLWPLIVLPMTVAVWLIDGAVGQTPWRRVRAAAAVGWWWGFGFFLAGLWWLGAAFLVEADKFAWAMPLGVVALPAGLAVFPALGFALARLLWPLGAGRILMLAVALASSEWLRGHVLTGFPWNVYGMMLAGQPQIAQFASVVGLYGLTLVAVGVAAAPAMLGGHEGGLRRWRAPVAALAVVAGLVGFGLWRIPTQPSPTVAGVKLRLMQPNLPQDAKFSARNSEAILAHYLALSDRATSPTTLGVQDVTHLIWPESAFPFLLGRTPAALARIAALLPPGATLITGAARAGEELPGESRPPIFNSVQVVDDEGVIRASYDKVHLVPFGEYLPAVLDKLIRGVGLSEFVSVPGGFAAGPRRQPLAIRGLPVVAPLICYEIVFPGEATPQGPRPGLLLNLTNDGWFGQTSGPYQHFAQARLRAVEEGLPLVRVANTGVTGVYDARGREMAVLEFGTASYLDAALPGALPMPPYARYGEIPVLVLLGGLAALVFRRRRRAMA